MREGRGPKGRMEAEASPPMSEAGQANRPPDPEAVAKSIQCQFTVEYRLRILEEADDRCTLPGEAGRLLRREDPYSSHLSSWRKARRNGSPKALTPKKLGARMISRYLTSRHEVQHPAHSTASSLEFSGRVGKDALGGRPSPVPVYPSCHQGMLHRQYNHRDHRLKPPSRCPDPYPEMQTWIASVGGPCISAKIREIRGECGAPGERDRHRSQTKRAVPARSKKSHGAVHKPIWKAIFRKVSWNWSAESHNQLTGTPPDLS